MTQTTLSHSQTILIGEDDSDILDILCILLSNQGYTVIPAAEGRAVQKALKTCHPNLILLDIRMPGISGKDIAKDLKKNDKTKDIPLVLISASASLNDISKEAHADACVAKPFNIDELLSIVSRYCPCNAH